MLYVGDPHFAQGDGEICGTAIEASLTARIQVWIEPELGVTLAAARDADAWYTHGFGVGLDDAMRMAARQMLWLMETHLGPECRRRLLAGIGGHGPRCHPGGRRDARLPRRDQLEPSSTDSRVHSANRGYRTVRGYVHPATLRLGDQ